MQFLIVNLQKRNRGINRFCLSSTIYLLKSSLLRSIIISRERYRLEAHYSGVSALLLEDQVYDYIPVTDSNRFEKARKPNSCPRKRGLFPFVVTVFKTLNWKLATHTNFFKAVSFHGFSHSIYAFKIIIHVLASAGLQMEVQIFLRDIISYYKEVNLDVSELFSTLLDSPQDAHMGGSIIVANVLIKVFAENNMLVDAADVFVQARRFGLELNILSCNFLLNCFAEANQTEFIRSLFEELKDSGPSPNVFTYTIMMNYYCKGSFGKNIDIVKATEVLP